MPTNRKRFLEVKLWRIGDMNRWESIVVTNRDHEPTPVVEEPDIVFCGGQMHPGLTWDNGRTEDQLAKWIGENSLGEAILLSINENHETNGMYRLDADECPDNIPTLVEWRLVTYI